jgi:hypothetical protein
MAIIPPAIPAVPPVMPIDVIPAAAEAPASGAPNIDTQITCALKARKILNNLRTAYIARSRYNAPSLSGFWEEIEDRSRGTKFDDPLTRFIAV